MRDLFKHYRDEMAKLKIFLSEREENLDAYNKKINQLKRDGEKKFSKFLEETCIPDLRKEINQIKDAIKKSESEYQNICQILKELPELSEEKKKMSDEEFWNDIDSFIEKRKPGWKNEVEKLKNERETSA